MAKQTFTTGQVLTAAQMTSLQQTAMGGGAASTKTTSYVLVAADAGTTIQMNAAGATTITLNSALFAAGDLVFIQNIGAGTCTITPGSATCTTSGSLALGQWEGGQLYFTSASASIFFDYTQTGSVSPLTTKGDVYTYSTLDARLAVGTNGQVLTAASGQATGLQWAAAASGALTLITTATAANTSTTLSVNNCFSATYDSYLIISNMKAAVESNYTLRLRVSSTDSSTGYYYAGFYASSAIASLNAIAGAATTSFVLRDIGTDLGNGIINISNPFTAIDTAIVYSGIQAWAGTNIENNNVNGSHHVSTSYTGISFISDSGNLTGTIKVYGYQNS